MDWMRYIQASRRFLYLLLIAVGAFFLQEYLHDPQRGWLVWTAFTVALLSIKEFENQPVITLFVGIALSILTIAGALAGISTLLLGAYLVLTAGFTILIIQYRPQYFLTFMILNVFNIISSLMLAPLLEEANRIVYIGLGIFLVMFAQLILLPGYAKQKKRWILRKTFESYQQLTTTLFSCFLNENYIQQTYLFEHRLHEAKLECLLYLNQVKKHRHLLMDIYNVLMDSAQLRRRIDDYATFKLCRHEMQALADSLQAIFDHLQTYGVKQMRPLLNQYAQSIEQFEINYHNILQASAPNPLAFILFISTLNILKSKFEKMAGKGADL